MADGRSNRKPNVVPFLSSLERNCEANLKALVGRAQQVLRGMPGARWEETTWNITGGRLHRLSGRNVKSLTLAFHFANKLGNVPLEGRWAELAKALTVLRFHRDQQNINNLRAFVHSISYVAYAASESGVGVSTINAGALDRACGLISEHYAKSSAYNMHKAVNELAAHLDKNKLCKVLLDYRYAGTRRPENASGVGFKRLDSSEAKADTQTEKMADAAVYELLGELYRNVPREHPERVYVLILTLLACLGRRFSEVTLLPNQPVQEDRNGDAYVEIFGRKQSRGDVFTPSRQVFCISEAKEIVSDAISEVQTLCAPARETAAEMQRQGGPDLRFLEGETQKRYYKQDLTRLGLSWQLLFGNGWLRRSGYAWPDNESGKKRQPWFTTLEGIKAYCRRDFSEGTLEPIHIDQFQQKYHLENLLFVQFSYLGGANADRAFWLATPFSHVMMGKWIERNLPGIAEEYAPESKANLGIRSHQFRHTINTLLDEGGLPELLQTRWFLRSNPRDTKAYHGTSRERNLLELRTDIQSGKASGVITEELKYIPVDKRQAYLNVRVKAVHDVGTGICVHNFAQTPCERHLECLANCRDYVHVKGDAGRVEEIKRRWAMTKVAQATAEKSAAGKFPKKSADWIAHNQRKLMTLERQMAESEVESFDPHEYLERVANG